MPGATPADALDGGLDLDEVGHRLDPDEVHAARDERSGLLGEDVDGLVVVERAGRRDDRAAGPDVAGDERVATDRIDLVRSRIAAVWLSSATRSWSPWRPSRSRLPPNVLVMRICDPASR